MSRVSVGKRQIGNYQLLNCIATSKFAQLWEVSETGSHTRLAMKLLLPNALEDHEQVKSLKHEAKVTASLNHPNVVKYFGSSVTKEHAYLLLELFKAPNVKTLITENLPIVQAEIHRLIGPLCLALQHVHEKGWVHKDIKPENVLFSSTFQVRLIDFEVSSRIAAGWTAVLTGKPKIIQGTRTYIAPETIQKKKLTAQTDIYSVGIMLFEILTGKPPFQGDSPDDLLRKHLSARPPIASDVNPNVTREAGRLVDRMLEKDPLKRPSSMQEIYGEFGNLRVFTEDVRPEPPTPTATAKPERAAVRPSRPQVKPPQAEKAPQAKTPTQAEKAPQAKKPSQAKKPPQTKKPSQVKKAAEPASKTQAPAKRRVPQTPDVRPDSKPAPAKSSDKGTDDDLPFMDELPPVV